MIFAVFTVGIGDLYSQEQPKEPPQTIENSQGPAEVSPGETKPTNKQPAAKAADPEKPPPPAPINGQRTTEEACDPRCQASEQRDKDDLIAQQSMADSTASMTISGWWQVALSIAGVSLIAVTARYAYRAAKAAEDINDITRESTDRQLRAYLSISKAIIAWHPQYKRLGVRITFKNTGQTPAYGVGGFVEINRHENPSLHCPIDVENWAKSDCGPQCESTISTEFRDIDRSEWIAIREKSAPCLVWGFLLYHDFSREGWRYIQFAMEPPGDPVGDPNDLGLMPCPEGNESN